MCAKRVATRCELGQSSAARVEQNNHKEEHFMNKKQQIYYHAIFGALGGLAGWWIMGSFTTQTWNIWVSSIFLGTGLGFCMGGLIAAADGAMIKNVMKRAIRDGIFGAGAGAAAGFIGLLLAQGVWTLLNGGFVARTLVWGILGSMIGLSDFVVHRKLQRASYAALGGLLGGSIGGFLYEGLTQIFLAHSGTAQIVIGGIGLVLIGACIGALIPLARHVFSQGELHVLLGKQTGLVREVTDSASIGSYDGNDLYLPDGCISWRHATIRRTDNGFELAVLPDAEGTMYVGTYAIAPGATHILNNGDRIRIGEALIEFVGR